MHFLPRDKLGEAVFFYFYFIFRVSSIVRMAPIDIERMWIIFEEVAYTMMNFVRKIVFWL
jgi:hypothetical protein